MLLLFFFFRPTIGGEGKKHVTRQMPLRGVGDLRHSPRELWIFYVLCFIDSLSYFMFSHVLMLHLTQGLELSDEAAGVIYGVYGLAISVFAILLGSVADQLQVRRALVASSFMEMVVRFALVAVASPSSPWLSAALLFLPMSFAMGLGAPVTTVGIRRFTTPRTSEHAFAIYYVVMNGAAAMSGPIIDAIRIKVADPHGRVGPMRVHAFLILLTAGLELLHFLISITCIRDVELVDEDPHVDDESGEVRQGYVVQPVAIPTIHWRSLVSLRRWVQNAREAWVDPIFRKLLVLSACLLWAKSCFRYLDAVYPIYIPRIFGEDAVATVPYMSLLSINPIIVITLTFPASMLFQRLHPVSVMTIGTAITAFAPFYMTLGTHWWAVVAFIVQLSLGEIVWSPPSYDYTAKLAPVQKEGVYFALAGIPNFLSKILSGPMTGVLMSHYCPSEKQCSAFPIWFFIGCTTMVAPIALLVFQRYIRVKDVAVEVVDPTESELDAEAIEFYSMAAPELWGDDGVL